MESIPLRRCSKCKQEYPLTSECFRSDASRKHGLSYICKSCADKKTHDYYVTHREALLECSKSHYQNNIEHRLAQVKEYYYNTLPYQRERKRVYNQRYRARAAVAKRVRERNNPEQTKARRDRYFAANPEKRAQYNHARRARRQQAGGSHTAKDIRIAYKSQKGLCWWCGDKLGKKYHVDHRIPLDKGGSNDARNICISCANCNLSKGAKMPYEFNGRLL